MSDPETIVYGGYSQAELDAQYNQAILVPDLAPYIARWRAETERARREFDCASDVSYGAGAEERLDIYRPGTNGAPVHVYLHGGAWRRLSTDEAGFPALQLVPAGACFVALNFDLADTVPLDEMVRQVRSALGWVYRNIAEYGGDPARIFVSGHSSGAHLTGMLLADGWRADAELPEDLIKGAIMVSGAYDLTPVRLSARNDYLQLDEAAARRNSPHLQIPAQAPPLFVGWGDGELDEFKRQGRDFAAAWAAAGHPVATQEFEGYNHFEVSNAFADPGGPIVPVARAQMNLE